VTKAFVVPVPRAALKYSWVHCGENQGAKAIRAYLLPAGRLARRVAFAGTWLRSSRMQSEEVKAGT
jgi:hypothetical protein